MTGSDMEIESDEEVTLVKTTSYTRLDKTSTLYQQRTIRPEPPIVYDSLVPDQYKPYYLTVENASNPLIEQKYGPFSFPDFVRIKHPNRPKPKTIVPKKIVPKSGVPKNSVPSGIELIDKNLEIRKLKSYIDEMERQKLRNAKRRLYPERPSSAPITSTATATKSLSALSLSDEKNKVSTDITGTKDTGKEDLSMYSRVSSDDISLPAPSTLLSPQSSDIDQNSDMSIETPPYDSPLNDDSSPLINLDMDLESMDPIELEDDNSSQCSFYSAKEDFYSSDHDSEKRVGLVESDLLKVQEERARIASEKKAAQVKFLEMKVRMSIEQNRRSSSKPISDKIGSKRPHESEVHSMDYKRQNINKTPMMDYTMNYMSNMPTYYPIPIPQYSNHFIPPPPNYLPPQQPPPPNYLPPQQPPPPPMPYPQYTQTTLISDFTPIDAPIPTTSKNPPAWMSSQEKKSPRHKSQKKKTGDIEPIKEAIQLSAFLRDTESFITLRVSDDHNTYQPMDNRPLPKPSRLVTIDDYTMSMDMLFIDQNTATTPTTQDKFIMPVGIPHEVSMLSRWHTSPLFSMLRRKATHQLFLPAMATIVDGIMATIPADMDFSLLEVKESYGLLTLNLSNTLEYVRKLSFEHPQYEFLKALKLELSLYVNGPSSTFNMDFEDCNKNSFLSVDIYWQRICSEEPPNQLHLILDLLRKISEKHTSFDTEESIQVSSKTTEVLIRVLRHCELSQVLEILTGKSFCISSSSVEVFSIDDAPGLYLTEHDKYLIWMLILHYYVTKTLPDSVCDTWMNSLVKDGNPTMKKPLFMIDWSTALSSPLERPTQLGAINILLSLLRYFGNKACNDARRRPLLIGVLRTLYNFLSYTPCYKITGALILAKNGLTIHSLYPEIQEIVTDLQIRTGSPAQPVFDCILSAKASMSVTKVLSLSYRLAKSLYDAGHGLLAVSKAVALPLKSIPNDSQMNEILVVDSYRQAYLSLLQMDSLLYVNNAEQKKYRESTYAWMNLLLLTQIKKVCS
ncbi:hypothetical protein BDB01DRAFT_547137 [Pilobolus umbonatus]|nr:hypothetical protein BDB01DRAFT_547137 [Pilobolus umbonatus]